jgi:hemerythrin
MPNYLEWREEYTIGHGTIDTQHERIVGIINTVFKLVREGGEAEELRTVFGDLTRYTIEHFSTEEALLQAAGYPDLPGHRELHRRMRERTVSIAGTSTMTATPDLAEETLTLLKEWWLNHIRMVDRQYIPWLAALSGS